MNVADERSMSCWLQDAPAIEAPPLQTDQTCDVVVIGSGIAGLSTAYELSRFGRSVMVIDRGKIGYGMTARTTAHLATELDDFYCELIRVRGEDEARIYYDSQVAAVNRIEAICREERLDAEVDQDRRGLGRVRGDRDLQAPLQVVLAAGIAQVRLHRPDGGQRVRLELGEPEPPRRLERLLGEPDSLVRLACQRSLPG